MTNYIFGNTKRDAATKLQHNSFNNRNEEIASLSSLIHELQTSLELNELINEAEKSKHELNVWQKANLNIASNTYRRATSYPPELHFEMVKASRDCEIAWRTARMENDFDSLAPKLDRVFQVVKTMAQMKAEKLNITPFDALISEYDPDRSEKEVKHVFTELKELLPPLMHEIVEKQSNEKILPLTEKIDTKTQKMIGLKVIEQMGFDMSRGRLDTSVHPFCTGTNDDVRITTRYDENNFLSSLYGIIHETGHGLYQQNLPTEYRNQPVGAAKGMAFHESQSLIMEAQVAVSRAFMDKLSKVIKVYFIIFYTF